MSGSVNQDDSVESLHSQGFEVETRTIHMPEANHHKG